MIVKQYIKNFEPLGFGMFVHFGIYSQVEKGEWYQGLYNGTIPEYAAFGRSLAVRVAKLAVY